MDIGYEMMDTTVNAVIEKAHNIISAHGFSTRIGGVSENEFESLNLGMNRGDDEARVKENWRRFLKAAAIDEDKFVCGRQVHGNYVHIASDKDARAAYGAGEIIEADGYVTNVSGLPIVIFNADCIPVILEDANAQVVGAVHSGWRSTAADIAGSALNAMQELGAHIEDIHVAIGPGIDKCCFEVGPEVIEAMEKLLFTEHKLWNQKPDGKYMLDLRGVVRQRFIQLGIEDKNIELVGGCTMCNPDRYFSHRYSGGRRGSMAAVVKL